MSQVTTPLPAMIDFLEHLEVERNVSRLTIRNYGQYIKRFVDWYLSQGYKDLKQLDKENAPIWFQVNFPVLYTELRVSDFIYRYNLRCSNAGKTHCV